MQVVVILLPAQFPTNPKWQNQNFLLIIQPVLKKEILLNIGSAKIADGVVATETLVKVDPQTVAMNDNFKRIIPESYTADIHYVINKADVRKAELKGEDVVAFEQKLAEAKADSNKTNQRC